MFFNVILTTIDGTFFVTLMQAMINIKQQATGVVEVNSSYVLSIIAVAILAVELISITIFLAVYHKRLDDNQRLKKRCGYIFEQQNYRVRGAIALANPILYKLRFVLLVFTILFLQEYLVVQCLIVSVSSIAVMVNLGFNKPSTDQSLNRRGIFNEYIIIFVTDSLLVSSDPNLDVDARENLGWLLIGLLGAVILVG